MNTSIHPVEESNLPTLGAQITTAKQSLSINRLLWKNWPDTELQQEQSLGAIRGSFNDPAAESLKAIDDNTGEILGFLITTRRTAVDPAKLASDAEQQIDVPERFNAQPFTAVMRAFFEIGKEVDTMERVEITAFAVRSDQQRRGVGSKLLGEAFRRAKADELPVTARSEPASHAFFQKKHGFEESMHVDLDLSEWTFPLSGYGVFRLTGMVWRP